jgi:hypothetical protein
MWCATKRSSAASLEDARIDEDAVLVDTVMCAASLSTSPVGRIVGSSPARPSDGDEDADTGGIALG